MSFDGEIIPEGINSKISFIFKNQTKVYGHFKMYLKGVGKELWDLFVESRLSFETSIGSLFRQKVPGLLIRNRFLDLGPIMLVLCMITNDRILLCYKWAKQS